MHLEDKEKIRDDYCYHQSLQFQNIGSWSGELEPLRMNAQTRPDSHQRDRFHLFGLRTCEGIKEGFAVAPDCLASIVVLILLLLELTEKLIYSLRFDHLVGSVRVVYR